MGRARRPGSGARGPRAGRRARAACYTSLVSGTSAHPGTVVMPWRRPASRRRIEPAGIPAEDEPPAVARLRERLGRGAVRLPAVPATVSDRPGTPRLERALRSVPHFEAPETDATAYDATIAAGLDELLVAVNFRVSVLSKADGTVLDTADLFHWFDDVLPGEVDKVFDPRVLYDQHEGRWVLTASAVSYADGLPEHFTHPHLVLSVSKTEDPRGEWLTWALPEPGPWADHPSAGVDAHAIYLAANLIGSPTPARLRVIPKAAAYAGGVLAYTDFTGLKHPIDADHSTARVAGSVFPCHVWGAPGKAFVVGTRRDHQVERFLTLWTVTDPGGTPALTCRSVEIPAYATGLPLAAEPGGPPILAGDIRVRNAVYSGGSVWLAFAATHQGGATIGARWYQLNPETGEAVQKGHFAVDDVHHCYPALVPDMHGNAVLVMGRTAPEEFVSVHVTARLAGDNKGEMPLSTLLHPGASGHEHLDAKKNNRWGDYHAAALDPADGVTVWVCGGYPLSETVWGICVGRLRV